MDFENVMRISDLINDIHLNNKQSSMIIITIL